MLCAEGTERPPPPVGRRLRVAARGGFNEGDANLRANQSESERIRALRPGPPAVPPNGRVLLSVTPAL